MAEFPPRLVRSLRHAPSTRQDIDIDWPSVHPTYQDGLRFGLGSIHLWCRRYIVNALVLPSYGSSHGHINNKFIMKSVSVVHGIEHICSTSEVWLKWNFSHSHTEEAPCFRDWLFSCQNSRPQSWDMFFLWDK